jgi:hypothetical protein
VWWQVFVFSKGDAVAGVQSACQTTDTEPDLRATPGGGGKVPLLPEYVEEINDDEVIFRNYEGKRFTYKQPKTYETPDIVPIEIAAKKPARKVTKTRRRKAAGE